MKLEWQVEMRKPECSIITTYRCNFRCGMCHIWQNPSPVEEEFKPEILEKLPSLSFCNLTGGEPLMREDLDDIVRLAMRKSNRVVISTNGYFTREIVRLTEKFNRLGVRVSIEGFPKTNDKLRGKTDGFRRALNTVLELKRRGLKDLGFAMTVSDHNPSDLYFLYLMAKKLNLEFATAVVHNSYYFHISDNRITRPEEISRALGSVIRDMLLSWRPKNWFRAYFNQGLINHARGLPRPLACTAGKDFFFLDPFGEVRPCNGMEKQIWLESFGNLKSQTFDQIWDSPRAAMIRERVKSCEKQCWMVGSASPVMKRYITKPLFWILGKKIRLLQAGGRM